MIYREFLGEKLSLLGFGAMRLPQNEDGSINEKLTNEMIGYALSHGVNYIDTAFPYHNSLSEVVVGKALANYPRDSFYLATKYPGHTIADSYDPASTFELQLKKCGVDYFDFYLLHNVYEKSVATYEDPRWGIIDYFVEQKKAGRIKHLGFSTHGDLPLIKEFVERHGDVLEFCQIQLNYLDWTLQNAKEKYEYLTEMGMPVLVMEAARGGKLAALPDDLRCLLDSSAEERSDASYAYRWLEGLDNVAVILSGMSDMEQVVDNCKTFEKLDPLNEKEYAAVMQIAEGLKDSVPCTACRYCCDGCPMQLDIPYLLSKYNQIRAGNAATVFMQVEALPEDKHPGACISCGKCVQVCPQKIEIPGELAKMAASLSEFPGWENISKQRNAELKEQLNKW